MSSPRGWQGETGQGSEYHRGEASFDRGNRETRESFLLCFYPSIHRPFRPPFSLFFLNNIATVS